MEIKKPAKVIGKGGFGVVTEEGDLARKHFKKLDHMIRELIMLTYMQSSKRIVRVKNQNLGNLTICCSKWRCSLFDVIIKYNCKPEQKMQIFKDILEGLTHMHQAGLIHSDVTLHNILVDTKKWRACMCDLGLSSITAYAKVNQTCKGYAPEKRVPCIGHDMFGLAVCMVTLFGGVKIAGAKKAKELRYLIRTNTTIPSALRDIFIKMCPDDPKEAITAEEVLFKVFNTRTNFELPEITIHKIILDKEQNEFILNQMTLISQQYEINRGKRCYRCLIQFFSGPHGCQILPEYHDLYMVAALYIYAALYGKSKLTKDEALEVLRGDYTEEHFLLAIQALITNSDFIASSIVSTH